MNRKVHRALQLHRRRDQFTLPPSGLKEAPYGDDAARARPAQAREIARLQEEDLRLKVRPGTKQALLELMEWAGIEEQGEALTLMIHHIEALGHHALFRIARHEIEAH